MDRIYMCIDLKSFYASVECVERGLDPLTTNLVVADNTRTEKTICLAVTPSLKQYGLSGRSRLFEVVQKVREINKERRKNIYGRFTGKSYNDIELKSNPKLEQDYIVAQPRMKYYMKYSTKIYNVYLKYLAPEDIYVYSIDEVFCDITNYLKLYKMTPKELTTKIIKDVYDTTGITATAGLGTNLYLAKIAMDIVAKHVKPNLEGVRIAALTEMSYRKKLWEHIPITDFWRVGRGYAKKLEDNKIYTMGDIALKSLQNEDLLYKLFGVNAEILIDHAWGYEPCTLKDIKNYKPITNSLSSGQVLHCPYEYQKARLIVREMIELLTLEMVEKHYVTDKIVLTVGYDILNLNSKKYSGDVTKDYYGREIPKSAHGTTTIDYKTSSTKVISDALMKLFDQIVNPDLLVRRINIAVCNLINEDKAEDCKVIKQFDLFTDYEKEEEKNKKIIEDEKKEKNIQKVILNLKNKYGKNSILKAMNLEEGATTIDRNNQVGGHKA